MKILIKYQSGQLMALSYKGRVKQKINHFIISSQFFIKSIIKHQFSLKITKIEWIPSHSSISILEEF